MLTSASAAPAAATLPLFLPQAPPDKVSGLIHAATLLAQLLGQGRAARQPCAALGDGGRLRRHRRGRGVGVEGRLRGARGGAGAVPAQIRRRRCARARARPRRCSTCSRASPSGCRRRRAAPRNPSSFQQFSTPIALGFVAAEAAALTAGRPRSGTVGRHGPPGDLRRARQGAARPERDRRHARRAARPPVPRRRGQPAQRRADPRPSRSGDPAERGADEPALLGLAPCRGALCRSRDPPCRLGARASRRRRTARRHHRPQCRSRSAGLARELRAPAGEGPRRLHRDARRPGLCPPRHHDRDAAHGHRPRSGRGPARLSALARHGRRRRRAARLGRPPGAAARAGHRRVSPARPRRVSGPRRLRRGRKLPLPQLGLVKRPAPAPDFVELAYETREWTPGAAARLTASLYEGYALQAIHIAGRQPHPTKLVQSAAMAAVAPPRPCLPAASAAAPAHRRHPLRRAARKHRLCRRGACRPSRRLLHRRRDLRSRLGRARGRAERGALPARLVPRRRHRRRQGPPGRRRSSSTTGSRAAAARSGSRNPTS